MKNKFLTKIFALLLIIAFSTPMSAIATTLKFAQISDIHYNPDAPRPENAKSFKMKFYALPVLDDAAKQIKEEKNVKFTLVTGDAADRPLSKDFEFIYKYLNQVLPTPWYYCLGNHDVAANGDLNKQKHIELLSKINPKGFAPDKTYYTFKPKKDMTFICLDAAYDNKSTPQGYLPPEQLNFLDKTICGAGDDVIVIFMHFPTVYPTVSRDHDIVNLYAFNEIVKKYDNSILVLGGHFHANKIRQTDNIVEVASPSLTSYPIALRFITIDNHSDKTVFTFDYRETNLKDVQAIAKTKIGWPTCGKDSDQNAVITVEKVCKCGCGKRNCKCNQK